MKNIHRSFIVIVLINLILALASVQLPKGTCKRCAIASDFDDEHCGRCHCCK